MNQDALLTSLRGFGFFLPSLTPDNSIKRKALVGKELGYVEKKKDIICNYFYALDWYIQFHCSPYDSFYLYMTVAQY